MKQIKRRLRALRLPGSLLALLLASSMLFNAFAVTVEQPSARGSGELPAEQTENKSTDDEAEPKNNAGFSSQKEALESVDAEEGTRYKVTFTADYDSTAQDPAYAQSITFYGVTDDS